MKKILALWLFVLGFSPILFAQSPIQQFDDRIILDIQATRTPQQSGFFLFLSKTAPYADIATPAGLFAGGLISHNQAMRQNAGYVLSSSAFSFGCTELLKWIVKRRRPYVQNKKVIALEFAGGYSFPSGHTSSSFATATSLSVAYPKWYVIAPSFMWAASVSYSRMYLGVHYPSDVLSGAALGSASAFPLLFLKK
jgi:membrane-associated phospholipid phosphatase